MASDPNQGSAGQPTPGSSSQLFTLPSGGQTHPRDPPVVAAAATAPPPAPVANAAVSGQSLADFQKSRHEAARQYALSGATRPPVAAPVPKATGSPGPATGAPAPAPGAHDYSAYYADAAYRYHYHQYYNYYAQHPPPPGYEGQWPPPYTYPHPQQPGATPTTAPAATARPGQPSQPPVPIKPVPGASQAPKSGNQSISTHTSKTVARPTQQMRAAPSNASRPSSSTNSRQALPHATQARSNSSRPVGRPAKASSPSRSRGKYNKTGSAPVVVVNKVADTSLGLLTRKFCNLIQVRVALCFCTHWWGFTAKRLTAFSLTSILLALTVIH